MQKMKGNKLFIKIGDFIVDFKYLFLAIFCVLVILCGFHYNNVNVNYDITSYLPDKTETKTGLELMEQEFGALNEIQLMITNTNLEESAILKNRLVDISHVQSVSFDESEDYFKDNNALFVIELDDVTSDERTSVKEEILKLVEDKEYYLYVENEDDVVNGMGLILGLAVVIIVLVLLFTSHSYFDILLAFIVFGVSIVLNMGSNVLLGEISYITKSIAVVLQLGLSLDYLIIFLNHYRKEVNDTDDLNLAVKKTVSKSIPEILASSFTTIAGLMALIFMQLKIGGDIGIVMSKGILCSLLTVIFLLPCLLILFHKPIMKLQHRNFLPDTTKLSRIIVNGRKVILPIFLILFCGSIYMVTQYHYVYNIYSVKAVTKSDTEIALEKIRETFGDTNRLVVLVKNDAKNYATELAVAQSLLEQNNIISVTNIGNIEIAEGVYLGTSLNYQEFASMFQIDLATSTSLYQFYAKTKDELASLVDMDRYKVTVVDWVYFLREHQSELPLTESIKAQIETYYDAMEESISMVETDQYSRFILEVKGGKESEETFELLNTIKDEVGKSYNDVTLVGESVSARDLKDTFSEDNLKISLITILFIAIILFATFKSFGIMILLILTIEGSIFLNFGFQTLLGNNIFFISYIIVSAIQMGATIDYAIVLTNRYQLLRKKMNKNDSLVGSLKDSLSAIITSGLILLMSGFLIGFITDSGVIASIGMSLGIGTSISLICTILVLPAILYACDGFIKATTLKKNRFEK